jgi:hypothetical protein
VAPPTFLSIAAITPLSGSKKPSAPCPSRRVRLVDRELARPRELLRFASSTLFTMAVAAVCERLLGGQRLQEANERLSLALYSLVGDGDGSRSGSSSAG